MNKSNQKEIAVECLERLNIYRPYINRFKSKESMPCFFENFGGFWADQEPELWAKIKQVEEKFGCLVYAVTHEFMNFGECWSMLCVSNGTDTVDDCLDQYDRNSFYAFAYVWNTTDEWLSEFGDIVVQSFGGGIRRTY